MTITDNDIHKDSKWKVGAEIDAFGGITIYVYIVNKKGTEIKYERGILREDSPSSYIGQPNWFHRLADITHQDMVAKKVQDCQLWCTKMNKIRSESFSIIERFDW